MPVNGNVLVQRSVLPDGVAGVDATVKKIVEMAHGIYGSKSAKIRALAIDIVTRAGIPGKDYFGEMIAIHNWVRDNIRYTRDPIGQETLSYPEETAFNSHAGDCDDMTALEIALLGAVGLESYPVVVGMFPNHFSHVYLHGKVPEGKGRNAGKVIPLDPIMKDWPAGREAAGVKAKKLYANLSNPLTMNGLPMGQELGDLADLADLGTYAIAPSYLDQENAHVDELVVHDRKSSLHNDKTVANATRVNMPFEGLDGLFGGVGAGEAFSSTSAGDGGTIVESGGQLVPKGFVRLEPDIDEAMAMTPATIKQLGPRGPIFARKAKRNKDYLGRDFNGKIPSLVTDLRNDKLVSGVRVEQAVGQKRYTLPSIQQSMRTKNGLVANPVRPLDQKKVIVLNSMPLDRLGTAPKKVPSLGEMLADAEAGLMGSQQQIMVVGQQAAKTQPLAQKEAYVAEYKALQKRISSLETTILQLRQQIRSQGTPGIPTRTGTRSAAVTAGEQIAAGMQPENNVTPFAQWVGKSGRGRSMRATSMNAAPNIALRQASPVQPMNGLGVWGMDGRLGKTNHPLRHMTKVDARRSSMISPPGTAGLGDGFLDTLKKPYVWGPILAFVGVVALRIYLKKRRSA